MLLVPSFKDEQNVRPVQQTLQTRSGGHRNVCMTLDNTSPAATRKLPTLPTLALERISRRKKTIFLVLGMKNRLIHAHAKHQHYRQTGVVSKCGTRTAGGQPALLFCRGLFLIVCVHARSLAAMYVR